MGNGRSSARNLRSVHAICALQSGGSSAAAFMYSEPLLAGCSSDEIEELDATEPPLDLHAAIHQLNSFFAVLWPVSVAMLSASLIACHVHDDNMQHAMASYMYYQDIDTSDASIEHKSIEALCNALVVVGFVACLTFGIVLLYKFDCIKFFLGYCVFYSAVLLGLVGAKIAVIILCSNWHWVVDAWSLGFVMYNFAVVGVLSIFYQKGTPAGLEQGYLVTTSVIVAWQLSQLPEWSVWMILLLLAFWDLFAVMTPIGPLRWLVDLVHEKGTPLPGLLYQADIVDAHRNSSPAKDSLEKSSAHSMASAARSSVSKVNGGLGTSGSSSSVFAAGGVQAKTLERHQSVSKGDDDDDDDDDRTIKLGLGDFIFYSVLVARAATHGIAVFASCFLCILVGLAITMYLLSKFDALPALPISIFLGILAYLLTTALIVPFLAELFMLA